MANENDDTQHTNNISLGSSAIHNDTETQDDRTLKSQTDSDFQTSRLVSNDVNATVNTLGNLTDLVAGLGLNSSRPFTPSASLGDCTNIRATSGPTYNDEGALSKRDEQLHESVFSTSTSQPPPHVQQPTQNSSFSFKHFLSSSNTLTAPSTTVTSLDPVSVTASTSHALPSVHAVQTSTGARPKVPQSASIATTSISSLMNNPQDAASSATKMKRSPRFSSFDSQASLAEYAGEATESSLDSRSAGGCSGSGFRSYTTLQNSENNDIFATQPTAQAGISNPITANSNEQERKNVPRSQSTYDIPLPSASPRRRIGVYNNRPNRLALNTNSCKLKLDLPINNAANTSLLSRPLPNNGSDFPPTAAASALPDFVQDHWMDSWYANEMHLNSPPNSPIGFSEDRAGGGATAGGSIGGTDADAAKGYGMPMGNSTIGSGVTTESTGSSKMLPDFLSDGPIIHSSQRLADVAAGLPSNSMGSPEDNSMTTQLSRLRIENERLQRELNEARMALNEQTRRGNELDRQLQERSRIDLGYSRTLSQNMSEVEAILDNNKKRAAATQSHVTKLKHQVTQLTAQVETLRRENYELREEGAVGGCSTRGCTADRVGARGKCERPSRTQQISKELLKAASNAENNLKQLLLGVDNLRRLAANIDNSNSPELYPDYMDDCDDFDEYSGGPAL